MDEPKPELKDVEKEFETFLAMDPLLPSEAIAMFDRARGVCPMPHSNEVGGYRVVLRDKDVRTAMMDWRTFANGPSASRPLADKPEDQWRFPPLDFDPPDSNFWRQTFTSAVNPKEAARVKERLTRDLIELLDAMAERGHGDLATEIGDIIPARAIFYLLGIEGSEAHQTIFELNRVMLAEFTDSAKRVYNMGQIAKFVNEEVKARRLRPRDDMLTQLSRTERDGRPLTEDELGTLVASMLAGGVGTTATAIADLCFEVLSRPEIRQQLIDDPSLVSAAVEESLRLHTPFIGLYRRVTENAELAGETLPQGTSLLMCWQSANLDPEAFEDPHAFRLDRGMNRHLTFGMGRHSCPGSPLARMELNLVLGTLLERYPNVQLAGSQTIEPRFIGGNAVAIPSLPVEFPH